MSTADRCAVVSIIAGALALSTGWPGFTIAAFVGIWWAYIELSVADREQRRQESRARRAGVIK